MFKTVELLTTFGLVAILPGCATIITGTFQEVQVVTSPSGAKACTGRQCTTTPGTLTLRRDSNHEVVIEKEWHISETVMLTSEVGAVTAGNIIFGGLVGLGIDAASGSMYKLYPESVNISLRPSGSSQPSRKVRGPSRKSTPEVAITVEQPVYKGDWSSVKAPVYQDGDWWVFQVRREGKEAEEEVRIAYKNGKFESDDPERQFLEGFPFVSVNLNDPKRRDFEFPLVPGKKWSFQYPGKSIGARTPTWRNADAEVIGPVLQPVESPAGSFKVIEIQRTDSSRAIAEIIYFYSPETKSVVKLTADISHWRERSGHYEMELIKYSVEK